VLQHWVVEVEVEVVMPQMLLQLQVDQVAAQLVTDRWLLYLAEQELLVKVLQVVQDSIMAVIIFLVVVEVVLRQ
jgi:hypothetical protein